jgi:hypothetical protein
MPLPQNGTFMDVLYSAQIVDVSTASIAQIPIMKAGKFMDAKISLSAAITGSDSVVTVKKYPAGVAADTVTIGTITLAYSGSAAGKNYAVSITGTEAACTLAAGDTLVFDNAAGSSTTSIGRISAIVRGP